MSEYYDLIMSDFYKAQREYENREPEFEDVCGVVSCDECEFRETCDNDYDFREEYDD